MDTRFVYEKMLEGMNRVADKLEQRGNTKLIRTLCYYNGNDGTVWDWQGGRTCEFGYTYEDSSMFAVKAWVLADGSITVYGYDKDELKYTYKEELPLGGDAEFFAEAFAALLYTNLDKHGIYDKEFKITDFEVSCQDIDKFHEEAFGDEYADDYDEDGESQGA